MTTPDLLDLESIQQRLLKTENKIAQHFLLSSHNLIKVLDGVFLDNMTDDFNNLAGAWPESYYSLIQLEKLFGNQKRKRDPMSLNSAI